GAKTMIHADTNVPFGESSCVSCGTCRQVCPTGAIRKLTMEEKGKVRIGLAMIDRSLCLPFAYGVPCLVCEEVCPTSPKAVVMTTTTERGRILKQPRVDLDKCVGCGICEAKCPIVGRPAITVISLGESRRPENRELWRP
ncbi:MAG: 4Fe-4S binding protein, partial [Syntrophales bacterium]|nr:4Fe-4S binding protein [Syntrophales bacterium]